MGDDTMTDQKNTSKKMGFNATWCMAVGGMIGGGIFSVLGVVVDMAGYMAWVSFIVAGLIALLTAISYAKLTTHFKEGGGAFTYIKDIHHEHFAGGLSWLLIGGYILTLSVYAFTFGNYLANLFQVGAWLPRVLAVVILGAFLTLNLRSVGDSSWVEIVTVWGKIAILLLIAGIGLSKFEWVSYTSHIESGNLVKAILGAGSIFMAYEGFQLITYDYEDIKQPDKVIHKAEVSAVLAVIAIYLIVTVGTLVLVGGETIIEQKEVAIAKAGQAALGQVGLIIATIAALFSTGSAINSTLFSTARLAKKVADDHELPQFLDHENKAHVPDRGIIIISVLSMLFATIGSLDQLVEGASFIFLFTFGIVNVIAYMEVKGGRIFSMLGAIGAFLALLSLGYKMATQSPVILAIFIVLLLMATLGRKLVYRILHK